MNSAAPYLLFILLQLIAWWASPLLVQLSPTTIMTRQINLNLCSLTKPITLSAFRAGEQVTISYGSTMPNELYFLLFGFVASEPNPHDSVTLFRGLEDVARTYVETVRKLPGHVAEAVEEQQHDGVSTMDDEEKVARDLVASMQEAFVSSVESDDMAWAYDRLVVTAQGFDARMEAAVGRVFTIAAAVTFTPTVSFSLHAGRAAGGSEVAAPGEAVTGLASRGLTMSQLLRHACQAKLHELDVAAEIAAVAGAADSSSSSSSQSDRSRGMQVSAHFREGKASILRRALAALGG